MSTEDICNFIAACKFDKVPSTLITQAKVAIRVPPIIGNLSQFPFGVVCPSFSSQMYA